MRGHLIVDVPLFAIAGCLVPWIGPWTLGVAVGLSLTTHAWAVSDPRCSLYLKVHWFLPDCPGSVALTFDDGPDPETTPAILDILAAAGLRATFFPIGENAVAHPDLIRRIHVAGHGLGLHSMRHPRTFPVLWPQRIRTELDENAAVLADLIGEAPRLFRPPMGLTTPLVAWGLAGQDLGVVTWTASGRDTRGAPAEAIRRRIARALRPGAILLLHDGSEPRHHRSQATTVTALRGVVADLETAGLGSVSMGLRDGHLQALRNGGTAP